MRIKFLYFAAASCTHPERAQPCLCSAGASPRARRCVRAELQAASAGAGADAAAVRAGLEGRGPLPEPAVVRRAAAPRAPLLGRRLPQATLAAVNSGKVQRRVAANALRCSACLFASSAGAGPCG